MSEEDDLTKIAGTKARKMSDEMKFVLNVQKGLIQCRNGAEVDLVFHKAETEAGQEIRWIDRIGVILQTVLLLDIGKSTYSNVVDLFLQIVKDNPEVLDDLKND